MERPDRHARDRTQVNPDPARPDFFEFLEKLFDGSDQKPEKLELRQAFGPGARKYGTTIVVKDYKANAPKPSREQLVSLSNEFVNLAQQNCDAIGKAHKYVVLAKHFAKSDTYYAAWILALRPKQRPGDEHEADADDDEETSRDQKHRDSFLAYTLDTLKESNENRRWEQDQFSTAIGHLFERYEHIIEKSFSRIEHLEARYLDFFKAAEEALSKKQDRDLAAEREKFKMGLMQSGFDFLKQMAPVAVNQLTGKQTIPTEKTAESIAVHSFLEGLSEQQGVALFGPFENGAPVGAIFTPSQAAIFFAVAECKAPPSELDRLLDGGDHAITTEQIGKAQTVVSSQQFMPLVALVMGRKKQLSANT